MQIYNKVSLAGLHDKGLYVSGNITNLASFCVIYIYLCVCVVCMNKELAILNMLPCCLSEFFYMK
jgi:hypothetical protein